MSDVTRNKMDVRLTADACSVRSQATSLPTTRADVVNKRSSYSARTSRHGRSDRPISRTPRQVFPLWRSIKSQKIVGGARLTVVSSSCNTWSYSLIATQKIIAVTSSKQWIHFFLSDLCPPTSNNLKHHIVNRCPFASRLTVANISIAQRT